MSNDKGDEVQALALCMQMLLEEHLLDDPAIADPYMEEVERIHKTITGYGYLVEWETVLDPQSGKLTVDVEVWEPKQNMTAEESALYDEWFLKANSVKRIANPDET